MKKEEKNLPNWKIIGCPEPRGYGQRFFLRDDNIADLYICDNSGSTPSQTDDGPLRFLPGKRIQISKSSVGSHGICISVPVFVERYEGSPYSSNLAVGVSVKELLWMLDEGYAQANRVEIDEELLPVARLYMRLAKRTCL